MKRASMSGLVPVVLISVISMLVSLFGGWQPAQASGLLPVSENSVSAQVDPAVQASLSSLQTGEMMTVIVTLRQRADLSSIRERRRIIRQRAVILALKALANSTQKPFRTLLQKRLRQGRVQKYNSFWIFNGFSVTATADVVNELAQNPNVLSITPDAIDIVPAYAGPEINISNINAPELWDLGYTGQGMVVATLDTGVDVTHPDLTSRWRGGTNSWFDPYGQHPDVPYDPTGHGTSITGVMVGGDAGGTSIGVAPGAQWIAVKVIDDSGGGTVTALHQGFEWLLDPDGNPDTDDAPNVVNNSWTYSTPGCNLDFEPDLQALRAAGILPIFAAGNYGPYTNSSRSPANNPSAFPVGNLNDNNTTIYGNSSRGPSSCADWTGPYPKLVAPGVTVETTDLYGNYTSQTGTSMAAPHVAGGLALLLSAYPDLSAAEQEQALLNSAADLGVAGPDNTYGYGRLDLMAAFNALASAATATPLASDTPTYTATSTETPPSTATKTSTLLPSATSTGTPVPTATYTLTALPSATATLLPPTFTPTATSLPPTATKTLTPPPSATNTATVPPTATKTFTPVPSSTNTPLPTASKTFTPAPSSTATSTPLPTATKTSTPLPSATSTSLPSSTATSNGTPINIGETNVLGTNDSGNGNLLIAQQATLSQTGTVQSLSFYVLSAAGHLRLGIYSNSAGQPGTLLAQTAEFVPVVGWNTQNVLAPVQLNAGTYWLAYLPESSSLHFAMEPSGTGRWYGYTYGALPATYSTSSQGGSYHWSFYATVLTGAMPTYTSTSVPTVTKTATALPIATKTATPLPSLTFTSTSAAAPSNTPTLLPTVTKTSTPLPTSTSLPTATLTSVPPTPTSTPLSSGSEVLYVSSSTNGTVGGVTFADEDILSYDNATNQWSMYFDGSDVGITGDVNAFALMPDGSILLSLDAPTTLAGVGTVDDSDITRFTPSSLGTNTSGTFSSYFVGANYGLTTSGEDIDAIDFAPDGRLVISTVGSYSVPGVSGNDEDLIAWNGTNWSLYFDGSDVGTE